MQGIHSLPAALLVCAAFAAGGFAHHLTLNMERRWKALSAGVAIAYIFVDVLPELGMRAETVAHKAILRLGAEKRIYIWTLAGFLTFTALGRLRPEPRHGKEELPAAPDTVFRVEMLAYFLYAQIIGFLVAGRSGRVLVLYTAAMTLHMFLLDIELTEEYGRIYSRDKRWLLQLGVLLGWGLGITNRLPERVASILFAYVAGGIVINSARGQIPRGKEARFWWFLGGAAGYASLLQFV